MLWLAAIACFVGATVQSSIGFGFALVLAPALFGVLDPLEALTTMLLLNITINAVLLGTERRPRRVRWPEVRLMALAAAPGLVAGAALFGSLSKPAIQVGVGVTVIAACALDARHILPALRDDADGPRLALPAALPAGLAAGFLTTTTTTNGPPMILLLRGRGATPSELRDSNATMLLPLGLCGLALPALFDRASFALDPLVFLPLLALTVAGQVTGRFVFRRLAPERFHTAGLAVVGVAGAASLLAGLAAL